MQIPPSPPFTKWGTCYTKSVASTFNFQNWEICLNLQFDVTPLCKGGLGGI